MDPVAEGPIITAMSIRVQVARFDLQKEVFPIKVKDLPKPDITTISRPASEDEALGIQADYVDYMMGHTVDTYHDIQSKGVEFLRGLYTNAGLRTRPKGSLTPKDQLRLMARGFGLSPEEAAQLLTSSEPHRSFMTQEEREGHEIKVLCDAITERIKRKILENMQPSRSLCSNLR